MKLILTLTLIGNLITTNAFALEPLMEDDKQNPEAYIKQSEYFFQQEWKNCDKSAEQPWYCKDGLIRQSTRVDDCLSLENQHESELCISRFADIKNNFSICEIAGSQRDQCYLDGALKSRKIEWCWEINNSTQAWQCARLISHSIDKRLSIITPIAFVAIPLVIFGLLRIFAFRRKKYAWLVGFLLGTAIAVAATKTWFALTMFLSVPSFLWLFAFSWLPLPSHPLAGWLYVISINAILFALVFHWISKRRYKSAIILSAISLVPGLVIALFGLLILAGG